MKHNSIVSNITKNIKIAIDAYDILIKRANQLTLNLKINHLLLNKLKDIDIVVSGGGNLDGYYLGMSMILSRLDRQILNVKRYAGASAGGDMVYEHNLKGMNATALTHIRYFISNFYYKNYELHKKKF